MNITPVSLYNTLSNCMQTTDKNKYVKMPTINKADCFCSNKKLKTSEQFASSVQQLGNFFKNPVISKDTVDIRHDKSDDGVEYVLIYMKYPEFTNALGNLPLIENIKKENREQFCNFTKQILKVAPNAKKDYLETTTLPIEKEFEEKVKDFVSKQENLSDKKFILLNNPYTQLKHEIAFYMYWMNYYKD